jgi:hypothetical protein
MRKCLPIWCRTDSHLPRPVARDSDKAQGIIELAWAHQRLIWDPQRTWPAGPGRRALSKWPSQDAQLMTRTAIWRSLSSCLGGPCQETQEART